MDTIRSVIIRGFIPGDPQSPALKIIGYKEIVQHVQGERTLSDAVDLIKKNTRHYAKRQMTWFRKDASLQWIK